MYVYTSTCRLLHLDSIKPANCHGIQRIALNTRCPTLSGACTCKTQNNYCNSILCIINIILSLYLWMNIIISMSASLSLCLLCEFVFPVSLIKLSFFSIFQRGTHHMNQSDIPFVAPTFVMNRVGSSSDRPAKMLTSNTAHHLNMEICHAFLKRYLLKGHTPHDYLTVQIRCKV